MNKNFTIALKSLMFSSFVMGLSLTESSGQSIYFNNIDGTYPSSGSAPFVTGQTSDPNITGLGVFRAGLSPNEGSNRYNTTSWSSTYNAGKYINVKFVVNEGYQLELDSMIVTVQRSNSGPDSVQFRSNNDGFSTVLGRAGGITTSGTTNKIRHEFAPSSFGALTDTVEFRFHFYNASGGTASINDFNFFGTVTPIPTAVPSIEITTHPSQVCAISPFTINIATEDVPEGATYYISTAVVGESEYSVQPYDLNEAGTGFDFTSPYVEEFQSYNFVVGVEVEGETYYSDTVQIGFAPVTYNSESFSQTVSVRSGDISNILDPSTCNLYAGVYAETDIESLDFTITALPSPQFYNDEPYLGKYFNFNSTTNPDVNYTVYVLISEDEINAYNALPEVNEEGLFYPIFIDVDGTSNLQFTVFHGEPSVGGAGPLGYDTTGKYVITPVAIDYLEDINMYAVELNMTGFSGVFPHTNAVSAPLNSLFGNISARANNLSNDLTFNTLSEEKNVVFEVLSSSNGVDFTQIGTINGKGTPSQYRFVDEQKSGSFYQVRMKQANGQVSLSKVVKVNDWNGVTNITIAPNPVSDQFTLHLPSTINPQASLQVIDALGRVVYTSNKLQNQMVVNSSDWAAGLYKLVVNNNGSIETVNFVKK